MRTSDNKFTSVGRELFVLFYEYGYLAVAFEAEKQRAVPPFLLFKMKQHYAKIILFCLCCLVGAKASAYDFIDDGIFYNLNLDGISVSVTNGIEYTGEVTIPESVTNIGKTYSVTSIGYQAFYGCSGLTSVTIPNSVTSIGSSAFYGCRGLTSVTIPNSVTSIGYQAFYGCSGLTSVTIPNSVTSIGSSAFYGCSGLTSVTIPNSVTSIGSSAFYGCRGLTSVIIPNSVTSIGYNAFEGCSGLTSVSIGNGVTSIGDYVFSRCSGLTSVTIGNSVTSIGYQAFYNCSNIKKVTINSNAITSKTYSSSSSLKNIFGTQVKEYVLGNDVTNIGPYAFYDYTSLTSVTIPNSVTSIGGSAFSGCRGLTSVTIPNSVTSIGEGAFRGCSGLTSVTIPNSVTSIGDSAFSGCSNIKKVTINSNAITSKTYSSSSSLKNIFGTQVEEYVLGNDVTNIGPYAFYDYTSLTSVTIPNSVTSIGGSAFYGCSGLTSVTIPNSVTSISDHAFYGCSGLTSVTIPNSVTSIGQSAFEGCSGLTSVTIPNSVTSLPNYVFENCSGLTTITIPNSVTNIGIYAFYGCSGLTSVIIPNSVTSIDNGAFEGCSGLTSVTIPNSVTSIGHEAFRGCSGLTSVTIPNSVTSIGSRAFSGCSGLTSVTIPNSVTSLPNYVFENCSGLSTITIPNSVTNIGIYAFYGCSGLTSVIIPKSVTNIGHSAFANCSGIAIIKVDEANQFYDSRNNCNAIIKTESNELVNGCKNTVIPNTVTSIGNFAFEHCSSLTSVTIPNGVTTIGASAFLGCNGLTSAVIGNSVESIGNNAFRECTSLASVTIGNGVTNIGDFAFYYCSNLKNVVINNNLMTSKTYSSSSSLIGIFGAQVKEYVLGGEVSIIGNYAFYGNSSLTSVTIGNGVTSIGDNAFNNNVKIFVNVGTTSLLALWNAGYTPYEFGHNSVMLSPTYYTLETSTQTTITAKVHNIYTYKDYSFTVNKQPLEGDIFKVENLCPGTEYSNLLQMSLNDVYYYPQGVGIITKELNPKVNFTSTASSITFNGTFDEGDAKIAGYVLEANGKKLEVDGDDVSSKGKLFTITGLDPLTIYKGKLRLTVSYGEGNKNTMSFEASSEGKTQQLKFSTQQPKVISVGNVIVAAEANLDEEETNAGFEWRRTDWTDDFASNTGGAYIYEGTMEGYIRNLNTEKLWKVRPYYESNSGKRYYGEWMGLDPTNTSYFEPTVHTYAKIDVQNNTASVKGYAMRGSDNVASQGFKYWKSAAGARAQGGNKVSVPADAKTVEASGQVMTAELTGLDYESSYSYVAFMTTTEGQTFYGEVQSFQTGVNTSGIDSPTTAEEAYEVARYDVKGRRISTPQRGLNILRLSDGSVRKVMVK